MSGTWLYGEGTTDYVAATPALIVTFRASGSIAAGRTVTQDNLANGDVYQPIAATVSGGNVPTGLALKTVSDGEDIPVLVWGYAKNVAIKDGGSVGRPGYSLIMTGAGYLAPTGSMSHSYVSKGFAGKYLSGSTSTCWAFIDCTR